MASNGRDARFNITTLAVMLQKCHKRLASVIVECVPWHEFLPRCDRPSTLFYLDTTYHGGKATMA